MDILTPTNTAHYGTETKPSTLSPVPTNYYVKEIRTLKTNLRLISLKTRPFSLQEHALLRRCKRPS